MPDKLFGVLHSIFYLVYVLFVVISSIIIIVHIFKTRYLDYYEKIKKDIVKEKKEENLKFVI